MNGTSGMSPESCGDECLRVTDLGLAARLLRYGRTGLDLLSVFLFAPVGLFALFLSMFAIVMALTLSIEAMFRKVGWNAGAGFMHGLNSYAFPEVLSIVVCILLLVVTTVGASVTAARTPRLWGIVATLFFSFITVFLFSYSNPDEGGATWMLRLLKLLATYGVAALSLLAALLLLAAIALRRWSPVGKIVQRWPRFSISIFAARYGLGVAAFWRNLLRIASRFVLVIGGLALAFVGAIFVVFGIGVIVTVGLGLHSGNWLPVYFVADIFLWGAVAIMSMVSAIRTRPTRAINLAVATFAALVVAELGFCFLFGALQPSGDFPTPVSEGALEILIMIAMVWLFRGLVSHALVQAYEDLKRNSARTARELADKRPEKPILFLRSFMDDEQLVPSSDALLGYAFGASRARVRLEEIVAEIMFARGPLVALANPLVHSSPLGAARDVAADVDWQDKVLTYLQASQAVICFLGKTKSFLWEVDRIVFHGKLDSTMIVLPPTYPTDRQLVHDAPELARLIGLTGEDDERARLKGVRVLVRDAEAGGFRAVHSSRADSFSYHEAILIGAATIQRNAELRRVAGVVAAESG